MARVGRFSSYLKKFFLHGEPQHPEKRETCACTNKGERLQVYIYTNTIYTCINENQAVSYNIYICTQILYMAPHTLSIC